MVCVPAAIGLVVGTISNTDLSTSWLIIVGYVALCWTSLALRSYIQCRNWMARQPRTMTFNDSGVLVKTESGEHRYEWKAFSSLRPRSDGYLLTLAKSRLFYSMPSRAFSSPAEEAECVELITGQLSALRRVTPDR